jgi:hypothetical protein
MAGHDYPSNRNSRCMATVEEQDETNKHVGGETSMAAFEAMRTKRDAELGTPRLLHASLQMNLRGGRYPPADENGRRYIRIPVPVETELP